MKKVQIFKKSKKKYVHVLVDICNLEFVTVTNSNVTPFHSAALTGHLWLCQRLLEGLFCNGKWNKFEWYGSPNLVLRF